MTDGAGPTDLLPEPMTPDTAATRISELKADPKFTEKYLANETSAREEFTRLHAVIGKGGPNDSALHRASQLATLKKHADLPAEAWAQVERDGPVWQHEREEALRAKERFLRDRATVARYLDGSREEVSLMTRINLILSSPVKTEGT